MREKDEALRILGDALEVASQGVDEAEVALLGGTVGLTRFAENEVHQAVEVNRESISVRVVKEGRSGRVETTDLSVEGIESAVRQARMSAQFLPPPAEPVTLPGAQSYWPGSGFDQVTDRASAMDRMALVGRVLVAAHRRGLNAAGLIETRVGPIDPRLGRNGAYALMNTQGLSAYHVGTRARISVTMADDDGASGWAESEASALSELDVSGVIDSALRKARSSVDPVTLPPGLYTVVLEPAAVAELIAFIGATCGAEDVERGRSFLSGRIGDTITGEQVHIIDDAQHPAHRGPPFDAAGVAKKKVTLIEDGVARGPVYSFESARRAGASPTGHRVHPSPILEAEGAEHLVMRGGDATVADLVGSTTAGVLVSRLWYARLVDHRTLAVTGMTRDGTFLIRDGVTGPAVKNVRFNVRILDVLERIEGMSASVWAQGAVVPAIKVSGFAFTGGHEL